MSNRASAGRYARALFDVALQEQQLDQVATDLARVADLVAGNDELRRTFGNPALPAHLKRKIVQAVADRLTLAKPVEKLLGLMADRDRLDNIAGLHAAFTSRLNAHRGIVLAEIQTAEPLETSQAAAWQQRLSVATGRTVNVTTRVDPSLLGGVRARIGSTVYDGSLATQLVRLRSGLVDRL
ncbi:MAG: ATP synthase F1 subunit delta [Vicinamibacterales bacterium]